MANLISMEKEPLAGATAIIPAILIRYTRGRWSAIVRCALVQNRRRAECDVCVCA